MKSKKRRNGIQVMAGLIRLVTPLLGYMLVAILMGCAGHLMATFITILGGYGMLGVSGLKSGMDLNRIFILLAVFAILRGILRYAEQACNHYIAFKLLARIRHQVFAALRKLAPAKLDGSKKGNLISIITSDIELLEVFYAHTISPIAIAVITSVCMVLFLESMHIGYALLGIFFYLMVGAVVPLINGKIGGAKGQEYRNAFGNLNTCVLDNLYGLEEILDYAQEEKRLDTMNASTGHLGEITEKLKNEENVQRIITDGIIMLAGVATAVMGAILVNQGKTNGADALIALITMLSSFGPTAALSALSNNLHHTLASGNRVLDILEEKPIVSDVEDGAEHMQGDISCRNIDFCYPSSDKEIFKDFSAVFSEKKIHGILGKSGCGKSTLLKLLMRFYETDGGKICYGEDALGRINTNVLRDQISYVTQETFLFADTIENNIRVAKEDATREEVMEAAKKAAIHDFILSLPQGYDTKLQELGNSLSGGEKQRIGIARAFLHGSRIIFLDEPTSNIDSLNEGMILRSLEQEKQDKTILLVSHRKSTMGIADDVIAM